MKPLAATVPKFLMLMLVSKIRSGPWSVTELMCSQLTDRSAPAGGPKLMRVLLVKSVAAHKGLQASAVVAPVPSGLSMPTVALIVPPLPAIVP